MPNHPIQTRTISHLLVLHCRWQKPGFLKKRQLFLLGKPWVIGDALLEKAAVVLVLGRASLVFLVPLLVLKNVAVPSACHLILYLLAHVSISKQCLVQAGACA